MSCGKAVAQGAHASITAVLEIIKRGRSEWREWLEAWLSNGQKKVVLKVNDEAELVEVYRKAVSKKLPASLIADAGLTELAPGTRTAVAIGPAPEKLVDSITGNLPLYR